MSDALRVTKVTMSTGASENGCGRSQSCYR